MPVKRRSHKRRIDPETVYRAWAGALETEFDFFDDLPALGVPTDQYGRPDREAARAAWAQYGARILAEHDAAMGPPWALTEFGDPCHAA